MSAKSIRFHDLARYKMFAGANMLADAVKVPLGPEGRDVICGDPVEMNVVDPTRHGGYGMGGMHRADMQVEDTRSRRRRPRLHRISLEERR
jgi:hypothetical protein